MQQGYLLGIGSNINPRDHLCRIIHALVDYFGEITLSRVITLPPIGMNSAHDFLNTVVFVATAMPAAELKQLCNCIETQLGRDRNDPQRKIKDRTADLDILTALRLPDDTMKPAYTITDEYFLYPLIEELLSYLAGRPYQTTLKGVALNIGSLVFGQAATTINRDTDSGQERVF